MTSIMSSQPIRSPVLVLFAAFVIGVTSSRRGRGTWGRDAEVLYLDVFSISAARSTAAIGLT